jgi:predicted nucleotidyltransferase
LSTWRAIRRLYVTKDTATTLATQALESGAVTHVFLFGSLARGRREPRDIDLLLYVDGEYSSLVRRYGRAIDEYTIDDIFTDPTAIKAAARLGWLDLVVVDGRRFGAEPAYTRAIVRQQKDPLFFVNISDGITKYHPAERRWLRGSPKVFARLALIKAQLVTENIVSS